MKKIFSQDTVGIINNRETSDVISNLLHSDHDMPRSHAAMLVGLRMIMLNILNYC